jgi:flagellar hook-associated protein 2
MPITATGLGSGLDVESIVSQLVLADIGPAEQRLNRQEVNYQSQVSAYGSIKSALSEFKGSSDRAALLTNYTDMTVTASETGAVLVTATEEAEAARYSLLVNRLATQQSLASDGFETTSSVVGTGTLTITLGTTSSDGQEPPSYDFVPKSGVTEISVVIDESNNTLSGLRKAINDASNDLTASIINDGSGYKLVLTSANSGLGNTLNLVVDEGTGESSDNTDTSGLSAFSFRAADSLGRNLSEIRSAQDANFTVNGLEISSSSNTVTEAVSGLTIELVNTTSSEIEVEVTRNLVLAKAAVEQFVTNYNRLIGSLDSLSVYDAETQSASVLTGDSTIRTIQSNIRSIINTPISNVAGAFSSLSDLGITTQTADGTLTISGSALDDALAINPLDVANVFASLGRPTSTNLSYVSASEVTEPGEYAVSFNRTDTQATLAGGAFDNGGLNNKTISFDLTVSGTTQAVSFETGTGLSEEDIAASLTSQAEALFGSSVVTVSYDATVDGFEFTSVAAGSEASIAISSIADDASFFGLSNQTGTAGTTTIDARINNESATYDEETNQLTGALGSSVEGLVLKILGGATGELGTVKYAVGLGTKLSELLDGLLDTNGLLDARITGVQESISNISAQRLRLQETANSLESRYRSQFNGLETLISQLNATQSFITTAFENFVQPLSVNRR